MNKVVRAIPNTITCFNLLCGCVAVVFALRGWTLFAGYCVFLAAIFDFFDGLAARALKAYSEIGKELDSLADMISFGLVPGIMLHMLMKDALSLKINSDLSTIGWELLTFFPFILTVFSALRLAKFNIDTRQSESFLGLPTPAGTLLVVSGIMYATTHASLDFIVKNVWVISAVTIVLSALLVSELPMFSLKIKPQGSVGAFCRKYAKQIIFILLSLFLTILWGFGGITLAFVLYILMSLVDWVVNKVSK